MIYKNYYKDQQIMKVIAINGGPNKERGNTSKILTPFLEGLKEAGAQVETFYTHKMNINPCCGNLPCQFKHPGKCWQKDDVTKLLPKLSDADAWVLATPLYCDGMTGTMKMLIDRIVPLQQPYFELQDDHCMHSLIDGAKQTKLVLVSTCGFWELDNFEPLVSQLKSLCRNSGREFAGALLRPHGGALDQLEKAKKGVSEVYAAAKKAGLELVQSGKISKELEKCVSKELLSRRLFMKAANGGVYSRLQQAKNTGAYHCKE